MRLAGEAGPVARAQKARAGAETLFLRSVARETWRFFDDLVGPESNWLPPDNTQLALRVEVAQRTSPTNIGLWFTSALAARDFGYLTADEFCLRCSRTMATLARMERYEGHLLNWYDTRTLEPLNPRYVSTVDSGNLIAALWVLEQGCNDVLQAPLVGHVGLRGLNDTLSILEEKCGDDPSAVVALQALRRLLRGSKEGHELIGRYRMALAPMQKLRDSQRWHVAETDERSYWASRLAAELDAWTSVADRYLRWMETLASPPDSSLLAIGPDAVKLRRRALRQMPSLRKLGSPNDAPTRPRWSMRFSPGRGSGICGRSFQPGWINLAPNTTCRACQCRRGSGKACRPSWPMRPSLPTASTCVFSTTRNASCSA